MKFDNESQMGIQISKYLDDELAPAEREMLEKHLAECGSCREVVQVFRRNEELLKNALCIEVFGNEVVDGVSKRLAAEAKAARPLPVRMWEFVRRPGFVLAAASLMIAALLGIVILQNLTIGRILKEVIVQKNTVDSLGNQLNEQRIEASKMEERRYREFAKDHWRKSPGAGVIATIEGGLVHFAMKPPEGKDVLHWSVSKRPRGQEGWPLPFSSPRNELTEPQSGEPMQYRFQPVLTSGETVDPYTVEVNAPPVLLNVSSRRNAAMVRLLNYDEKTRTAAISVTRYDGGERSEAFKVTVGGPVGAIVPDRTGSLEDLRTGYLLAEVERGTQTIATTSTVGLSYTRDSWRAVLRPAAHPDAMERVELWKDAAVEFQIKLN